MTSESSEGGTEHESSGTGTDDDDIVFRLFDGFVVRGVVVLVWAKGQLLRMG